MSRREQPTNNTCGRGQCGSSVVKQQERLKEKCLARAKMQVRWRNKTFASILHLPKELKSRMSFGYLQHCFSRRRDFGGPHIQQSVVTCLQDPHLPLHQQPGQSQMSHEAVMPLTEAISSNSNLEKCDHIMVMNNKTTLRSMGNGGC